MHANDLSIKRLLSVHAMAALLVAFAGTLSATPQSDHVVTISVSDPRPLASAVENLEKRYGWVITYEDPPYLHPSEIVDVTQSVRKDRDMSKGRVLIPRGGLFDFTYNIPAGAREPQAPSLLEALLEEYHLRGNVGMFRVVRTGTVFHIVPSVTKNLQGNLEARHSILDTNISVSDDRRTAFGMLEAIKDAVSRSSGAQILILTVPMNLIANVHIQGGAKGESARTVLLRTLDATNRKLSWQLFREPGPTGRYGLNVHVVNEPVSQLK